MTMAGTVDLCAMPSETAPQELLDAVSKRLLFELGISLSMSAELRNGRIRFHVWSEGREEEVYEESLNAILTELVEADGVSRRALADSLRGLADYFEKR